MHWDCTESESQYLTHMTLPILHASCHPCPGAHVKATGCTAHVSVLYSGINQASIKLITSAQASLTSFCLTALASCCKHRIQQHTCLSNAKRLEPDLHLLEED